MSESYRFEPKEDISLKELAEILKCLEFSVHWSVYSRLSVDTSRHFTDDDK